MSMIVQYFIVCNQCGTTANIGDANLDPGKARRIAKQVGFVEVRSDARRGARYWTHYCPSCATKKGLTNA